MDDPGDPPLGRRRLTIAAFAAIVLVDLALITAVSAVSASGLDHDVTTSEEVVRGLLLPVGASLVFVYAVVAALGWWRPVFVDDRPVQRWVWVVPIVFAIAIAIAIDYGDLADKGAGFVLLLLLAGLCVGFSEEGLFRGIGVTTLRTNGLSEGKVALWSSVIFGAAHLVNALSTGDAAIAQAIAVSFAGYFFYLTRRVSGGLVVPALVHGMFDFSILSGAVVEGSTYAGSLAAIAAYPLVAIILVVRRRHIEP